MWSRRAGQIFVTALFVVPLLVVSSTADGQQVYIYPNHGQSAQQQSRDRNECHTWAVQQTGVDPTAPAMVQSTPPGGLLRGAAGGAALGAVGGAIAGDAGKGAAIGAATGGLFGTMKRRSHVRQEQAVQGQQQAAYERALSACLAGRGYTVR